MNKRITLVAAAVAAVLGSAAAHAQQASGQLEDVVVTAQKREESAQKTAISMSVYTAEDIVSAGVHDVGSLAAVDPSINLTTSNGTGYVAVRGIASTDVTEIGDPAVAIARDGFFTNRSYSLFSSMYDVERIEVLKGPQGTLFGRNSTGGAINIITKKPGKELAGYVSADLGNYSARNFEAAVNLPMGDKVALRVSGVSRDHSGYRDNGPLVADGDDETSKSGRIQLGFEPFENFTGWVSFQYDRVDDIGDVAAKGTFGQLTKIDPNKFPLYVDTFTDLTSKRARWQFDYSGLPGGATITYLGGRDDTDWGHRLDASGVGGAAKESFNQAESPLTTNHELRISSASGQRLFWQAGLFYFKEKNSLDSGLVVLAGPFANQYLIRFNYDVETVSKAAFGQLAFNVTDALKLSAGVRYTKDSKVRTGNARLNLQVASGGFLPPIIVTTPGNGNLDDSKPTFHVGADWQLTDSNLVYVKYDTGYKSGGFNSNGSAPSVSYGPENVKAIEIGTKNRFADDRVQLNAALFHQKYQGYQAAQFTPALGGGPGIQNAGSAKITGLEADLIASTPAGRFNASASVLNTEFTKFLAVNATGTATVDLAGNDLPNAPKFALSAGWEYAFPVGASTLTARIDGKYSAKFNYSFFNFADTETPDATTVGNASLTYAPGSAKWSLQGYVRNFTDETVYSNIRRNSNANIQEFQFAPPRTYGLRFQYTW